jgi:hypothetical protein
MLRNSDLAAGRWRELSLVGGMSIAGSGIRGVALDRAFD